MHMHGYIRGVATARTYLYPADWSSDYHETARKFPQVWLNMSQQLAKVNPDPGILQPFTT